MTTTLTIARRELSFDGGAAGVEEGLPVAGWRCEPLEDEALAAEESDAEFFLECDADLDAARRSEE